MYDLQDDEFTKSYDAEKAASKQLTPFFPYAEYAGMFLLKGVTQGEGDKMGKYFEFKVQVVRSNNDLVVQNASYIFRFKRGASKIEREQCWKNMLPLLMASKSTTNVLTFNAPEVLGELLSLTKDLKEAGGGDLDLAINHQRKMEDARKDKETGKYRPKDLQEDGVTPKKYPRDTFTGSTVTAPNAAAQ